MEKMSSKELNQRMKEFETGEYDGKILTDAEKEELGIFLKEAQSEDSKLIESLPSNNGISETVDNKEEDIIETVTASVDPNTGTITSFSDDVDKKLAEMLDVNIEDLYEMPKSAAEIPYDQELVKKNASSYGLKDDDIIALLPLIDEYRAGNKDTNWYTKMPNSIKEMINKQCAYCNNNTMAAKKLFSEELISGLIRDAGIDRIAIDLQEVTKKAFDISGIMKMTLDYQNTILEVKLRENADKLEAEGKNEKAEQLRKVAEAYRQSYMLENFIKVAETGKLKVKDFDVKKYKRFVEEFNYKYEKDTPFVINDISSMAPVLVRKFCTDGITTDHVIRFIIAFCKYCQNMDATNVVDHTFMSYVIINVSSLDLVTSDQGEGTFINAVTQNIKEAIKVVNNLKEEE